MDRIRIRGGNRLNGTIPISGAKNAALPLMIVSLLTPETLTLSNVPRLADVQLLQRILQNHGVDIMVAGKRAGQNGRWATSYTSPPATSPTPRRPMNSSPRCGRASGCWARCSPAAARRRCRCPAAAPSAPGRSTCICMAMEKLGAEIEIEGGYVIAKAKKGLKGAHIMFDKVSVGATHAALMAAALAHGDTIIENAAREPEIGDVAECLVKMGAKIEGIHTSTLKISGVTSLSGAEHNVIPDRIETGTYAMCVGMTGGDVLLKDANAGHLGAVIDVLRRAGVGIDATNEGMRVHRNGHALHRSRSTPSPIRASPPIARRSSWR